jgi:hypothetical protein
MRYRLSTLLIAVLSIGLLCAALKSPTHLTASLVVLATASALFASVLIAIYRQGKQRAFALGFALFGFGLFALILLSTAGGSVGNLLGHPQSTLARIAYEPIHGDPTASYQAGAHFRLFSQIANGAFVILFGILGGMLSQWLYLPPKQRD